MTTRYKKSDDKEGGKISNSSDSIKRKCKPGLRTDQKTDQVTQKQASQTLRRSGSTEGKKIKAPHINIGSVGRLDLQVLIISQKHGQKREVG